MSTLLTLFRSQGHELQKEGKSYKTCCPFHADKTPSLLIDPEKGLWNCFGCEAGGDGVTFLERSLGLSFGEAADRWKSLGGELRMQKTSWSQPQEKTLALTAADVRLFKRLQEIYARALASNKRAQNFLEERGFAGLDSFKALRSFGIGFVSGKDRPEMTEDEEKRAQRLGILNAKGNETLYNCIVCPIYTQGGEVVGFYGRRIVQGKNPHRALPQNSNSAYALVNYPALHDERLILVEGFLDALAFYQSGLRNVIPVGGCSTRPELLKLIREHKVKKVFLAFDPDEAGDESAKHWAHELYKRGVDSERVRLPYDPAECLAVGLDLAAEFRSCVKQTDTERPDLTPTSDNGSEYLLDSHDLLYRVRPCGRPVQDKLKVQILVEPSCSEAKLSARRAHRDILNLYIHKSRKTFANACRARLESILPKLTVQDIETDLEKIIEDLEERARQISETEETRERPTLSPQEKAEALAYLSQPELVKRLLTDMEALGYVGEEEAKLLVYLIATSRKLPRPLSGIIGSGSGAGKSFLAELAEQLTPPEDVELFSKLSSQALYYLPKDYLRRKLLILEERAGGEGADYAIRTLQTKDRLTQMVTLKDENGKMAARHYEVMGPIAYLETTTQSYLNPENTSRCFEIPLDESAEQTKRIHEHQRRARGIDGLKKAISKESVRRTHHNAQRLLEEVRVVIPYAEELTFPARYLRTRRDHERFLSLIEAVAFLHQFQRPCRQLDGSCRQLGGSGAEAKGVRYIEATVEDYAIAYRLALRVLWVSLDELSRWGRELIESCRQQAEELCSQNDDLKTTDVHWTRRQLREHLGWPDKRLRACLDELVSLEYLQTLDGSKGKAFVYRLNPDFSHNPRGLGLLTPEQLEAKLET